MWSKLSLGNFTFRFSGYMDRQQASVDQFPGHGVDGDI